MGPKQDQVITVALDGRLHSWQVTGGNAQPMGLTDGTQGPLTCLGFDLKSRTYVGGGKNSLLGISGGAVAWSKAGAFPRRPTAVASRPGALLAVALEMPEGIVGGVATNKFDILLYGVGDPGSFEGLSERAVLESHKFEVTTMKISPNGRFLASADASKNILVWGLE